MTTFCSRHYRRKLRRHGIRRPVAWIRALRMTRPSWLDVENYVSEWLYEQDKRAELRRKAVTQSRRELSDVPVNLR